jgi:TolB-like protein/DNA-binding winged helix-turn-helix (wHTH) protein/cytochrome c-type biogenesis protein CcmH/NrfG
MPDSAEKVSTTRTRLVYRLEDLIIDVGTAEVRRGEQSVPLPRLSFDLLLALVKAAPNLVTVDELMDQVWPDVVVNAETVSQRIKLLRVALDDDPKQPRYIAVSRGRGYRVVGQVTTLDGVETPAPSPAITPERPPPKLLRWTWASFAALGLAALASLLYMQRDRPPQPTASLPLPDRSVAVLPFDNLGQSPKDAALAFGVAETLLHRLSASKELTVIARQSSFSFAPHGADVRDIGRKLNARFLVEGSLQSTPDRLRITAQLIDASTGGHVWSLQFDRKPEDIFVIQDEIAAKVTEAMRITLAGSPPAADRGTKDFDAYLAAAQGRARLATTRLADAKLAVDDFERAIQIDPKFARAYAGLAEARLAVAVGEMSRDHQRNLEKTWAENRQLLEHALTLNELDADTHLQLADLYWEGERAEKELARALELNPNSAPAYRQLATVKFFRDNLPEDSLNAIDTARRLSPLEVLYDNEKAMYLLWGKSDAPAAEQLSLSVLDRDPSSSAALWRLGEIYWCCRAQQARGIKYLEQALKADPDYEFGRRILINAYLELGEAKEAEAVAASAPHVVSARMVQVLAHAHDYAAAAELGYEEDRLGTAQPIDSALRFFAMRIQARADGKYDRAITHFMKWSLISWDAQGQPVVPSTWMGDASVALADVLMQKGEQERAQRLIAEILKSFDKEAHVRGRGDFWYLRQWAILYALLGRDDEALTMLERNVTEQNMSGIRLRLTDDPVFDHLRSQPRFRAVLAQVDAFITAQRLELDQMRAKGLVPYRSRG